jgi:excisionase family DNA binding protein
MNTVTRKPLFIEEAASYLRLSKSRLYKLAEQGIIASSKPGRRLTFQIEDLNTYLNSNRRPSKDEIISRAQNFKLK